MIAIYVRQSLEKKDSISLDTQADYGISICKQNKWKYEIYRDSGASGKDIDRPAFQKLLKDIKNKKITKVITYRLDRISRNIVDFGNLIQMFQKYNVDFISATENFDTSTPIGRAMIYIIMVFAQLERETIATRITDNYYARAKNGTFVGGAIPYGYSKKKIKLNDKKTSVLFPIENNVKQIYDDFLINNKTLRAMSIEYNLSSVALRRILSNPFYVKADANIYNWLQSKGYIVYNNVEDFNGKFGVQIFGKEKGKKNREFMPINEQLAAIGKHTALIDSSMFLLAQEKLENNKNRVVAKKEHGKYSFITGIVKCGNCGSSIGAKVSIKNNITFAYALCSKHRLYGTCENTENYKLKELERVIMKRVRAHVAKINFNIVVDNEPSQELMDSKNELKIKIIKIDEQINNLIEAIATGTNLSNVLEEKINTLINEKRKIEAEILKLDLDIINSNKVIKETDIVKHKEMLSQFSTYEKDVQRDIIRFFVDTITLTKEQLTINYRI